MFILVPSQHQGILVPLYDVLPADALCYGLPPGPDVRYDARLVSQPVAVTPRALLYTEYGLTTGPL
jgi:hypothetical protein